MLDEPTNDLDIETLELRQEVIADYDGTVMIVSHDRDFLDCTVTGILAFEGDAKIVAHVGGYSDYVARKNAAEAREAGKKVPKKPVNIIHFHAFFGIFCNCFHPKIIKITVVIMILVEPS